MVGLLPGGNGNLITRVPNLPLSTSFLLLSKTFTLYPGADFPVEPGFIGNSPGSIKFPAIDQPVSVCHQWSITGIFKCFCAHFIVSGSALSPAKN